LQQRTLAVLRRARLPLQLGFDISWWFAAIWLANGIRYDFAPGHLMPPGITVVATLGALGLVGSGFVLHLYRGRHKIGAFDEVAGIASAMAVAALASEAANLALPGELVVPRSAPVLAGLLGLLGSVGARYAWRVLVERGLRPSVDAAEPLLLFGAGEGAEQAIVAMLRNPDSTYLPVGLLDDMPRKRLLRLRGVPVLGTRQDLATVAKATSAKALLLAIPSANAALVREISALAEAASLHLLVLPPVSELIDGRIGLDDIRELNLSDLLGRRQIELDLSSIAGYLTGKRVLVTGAGGSIGSELCRQLVRFHPAELIMLDRDESALHAVQLMVTGRALLDDDDLVLADIRDTERLQFIFQTRRPQVVFHAAALKHLTLLERNPGEAVKSNVWGTLSVLEAARESGVERFVNISTDKAADPASVLGYSKRIAERLTAHAAQQAEGLYLSVRFGNVLGSRGSVLTAFTAQVEAGGPITVTHREVTRYFMTIQEAVQLVIQAGAVGSGGEVLVLDMGDPVRIDDVARRLADDAPHAIDIVYTGLRPGEKLHEDLLAADEVDERPSHPLISQVPVPPLHPVDAWALDAWAEPQAAISAMRSLTQAPADVESAHQPNTQL